MRARDAQGFPVIGCLPYGQSNVGFALPLLADINRSSIRLIQQVDEFRNVISGFKRLEDHERSHNMIPVNGPRATIGNQMVHVFITDRGVPQAGTLADLTPVLQEFANRCANQPAIVLQIRELIGTDREKKAARLQMRTSILSAAGASAAYSFYELGALRSALWGRLLRSAPDAQFASRIFTARPQLSAQIETDGSIKLDLNALAPEDLQRIDQEQIKAGLMAEFLSDAPMISIIDDDPSCRKATDGLVRSIGYRSLTFASAEDFLQSDYLDDTSCVIADVQMPGLSGVELQSELNARGTRMPIIFITAFPEDRIRRSVLEAGAIGFLSKPFEEAVLIEHLHATLGPP